MSRLKELRKSILLGVYINLILLHILPIWLSNVFVTLDGPAHSYSGALIRQLVFDQGLTNQFFQLRTIPPPNCFVHLIQALFNGIINPGVFDKILHSLWIFSFLFLSRSLILKLNPRADYRPFLMFPFVFSFPFVLGFQNFLWGIIAILIALHQLLRLQKAEVSPLKMGIIHLAVLLFAYSTHLIAILIIPTIQLVVIVFHPKKANLRKYVGAIIIPFILVLIPVFLLNTQGGEFQHQTSPEIFTRMYNWIRMSSLVSFSNAEQLFIWPLGVLYSGLLVYCVISLFRPSKPDKVNLFWQRLLTFSSLGLFILYFILPDHALGGGFILVRIQIISTIFLIPALACIRLKKVWMIPLASTFVVISLLHLKQQYLVWSELGKSAGEYIEVVDQIPTNSIVLPVIWYDNWMFSNFPCLLGSRKQIIVLDNYEVGTNHFLVQWKKSMNPSIYPGFTGNTNNPILNPDSYPKQIDFVYSLGNPDTTKINGLKSANLLKNEWQLIWTSSRDNAHLYKKKAQPTL